MRTREGMSSSEPTFSAPCCNGLGESDNVLVPLSSQLIIAEDANADDSPETLTPLIETLVIVAVVSAALLALVTGKPTNTVEAIVNVKVPTLAHDVPVEER